jgi:hypothetical protein
MIIIDHHHQAWISFATLMVMLRLFSLLEEKDRLQLKVNVMGGDKKDD